VDVGAACDMGGVMGATQGMTEVNEAGDEGAGQGLMICLPRVAVRPPTFVPWAV
jgi:hypothetical protein